MVVLDYLKQITFPFHISHHPNLPLILKLVVLTFKSFWYLNVRETLYLQIVTVCPSHPLPVSMKCLFWTFINMHFNYMYLVTGFFH